MKKMEKKKRRKKKELENVQGEALSVEVMVLGP